MTGGPTQHLDTQVVVEAFRGRGDRAIRAAGISSVAVSEFLGFLPRDERKWQYVVPLRPGRRAGAPVRPCSLMPKEHRDHPYRPSPTDLVAVRIDARGTYHREYGSRALAQCVNNGDFESFQDAIAWMDRRRAQRLLSRFRWLVEQNLECIPLDNVMVSLAETLIPDFQRANGLRVIDRNSVRDMLILATARVRGAQLVTGDRRLGEFATGESEDARGEDRGRRRRRKV